jgi:hypothetical protein
MAKFNQQQFWPQPDLSNTKGVESFFILEILSTSLTFLVLLCHLSKKTMMQQCDDRTRQKVETN